MLISGGLLLLKHKAKPEDLIRRVLDLSNMQLKRRMYGELRYD
jgi:hypothetical protein